MHISGTSWKASLWKALFWAFLAALLYWIFDGLTEYVILQGHPEYLNSPLSPLIPLGFHVPPHVLARRLFVLGLTLGGVLVFFRKTTQQEREIRHQRERCEDLEKRLAAAGTREEEHAREMEAFRYTISHDLRGPLRTLEGFSQILMEEYSPSLDAAGQNYLERIRRGSLRMGELIDDLLMLSRISGSTMVMERFSLSESALSTARELEALAPRQKVRWEIEKNITVLGDPRLLGSAIYQLLENAWKFSALREEGHICFGAKKERGTTIYFVRDNGEGFSMEYRHKLFLPFERLHRNPAFSGTGIGLALVQRILKRHGGTIWAESSPDKGATFYFTLWEKGAPHERDHA